jgi:NADPH:quinone reductase-like Zn-dependent oxidoreductase
VAINAATGSVSSASIQVRGILKANPYIIVTNQNQIKDCIKLGAKGGVLYKDNNDWAKQLL